ncbi:MAG: hypothetical protein SXA11_24600, partial [Cyanobacteriota bacterium]|nr:hypothetical protein [Cyanobacteriota bacterium]
VEQAKAPVIRMKLQGQQHSGVKSFLNHKYLSPNALPCLDIFIFTNTNYLRLLLLIVNYSDY